MEMEVVKIISRKQEEIFEKVNVEVKQIAMVSYKKGYCDYNCDFLNHSYDYDEQKCDLFNSNIYENTRCYECIKQFG